MKITIDDVNKTVSISNNTKLSEIIKCLKLVAKDDWEEYEIVYEKEYWVEKITCPQTPCLRPCPPIYPNYPDPIYPSPSIPMYPVIY